MKDFITAIFQGGFGWRRVLFLALFIACFTPYIGPPIALIMGLIVAQLIGHPYKAHNKQATTDLLKYSVVGLGFGMNLFKAMEAGKEGFLFTIVTIAGTITLGLLLGRLLRVDSKTSKLVSSGTAICGGSAIAAVSPIVKAEEQNISVALGIVFILNSIALLIFPPLGNWLELTQQQFGLWAAIAIHDTSSVVGAAASYGAEALQVATTVKLARALWIIPLSVFMAMLEGGNIRGVKIPWFIGLFVLAMLANTYLPFLQEWSPYIVKAAKAGLTATLFLIGAGLNKETLRSVGFKPMIQGVTLWMFISVVSLFVILNVI